MKNLKMGQSSFESLSQQARQVIFDLVYPVGSYIYIDNPDFDTVAKVEAYYGGHWEKITDRVLYGVSSGAGTDTGNNNPTVPVPKHNHTFSGNEISGQLQQAIFRNSAFSKSGVFNNTSKEGSYWDSNTGGSYQGDRYNIKFNATPSGSISDAGTDGATIDVRGARRTTYIYHRIAPVQNS